VAQSADIDLLASKFVPEIERMMLEGKVPSAAVALVLEDQIIWTGAFGYSNLWANFAILTNGHRSHKHLYNLATKAMDLLDAYKK